MHWRKPESTYVGKTACQRLVQAEAITTDAGQVTCRVCHSYAAVVSTPKARRKPAPARRTTKDGIAARAQQIFKKMGL
jgi:hypothetical protein